MNVMQEIESGNFSVPRWNLFSPDSVRVVSWNIDRGSKLHKVIEFLAGEKADIILLQEADLNARRTHHLNVAREIAQKLAMNYVFGREVSGTGHRDQRRITCLPRPSNTFALAAIKFPHHPVPETIAFLAPRHWFLPRSPALSGKARRAAWRWSVTPILQAKQSLPTTSIWRVEGTINCVSLS